MTFRSPQAEFFELISQIDNIFTGDGWTRGDNGETVWVSLRPGDMRAVSGDTSATVTRSPSVTSRQTLSNKDKEKSLTAAVIGNIEMSNELEQDKMEGVDAAEWEE